MFEKFDLVIRNPSIFDGTGAKPFTADVAIQGDRIARVGTIAEKGAAEIDGAGLALSPGFIDVHSHDDMAVLLFPEMDFKVMQGVTTDIVGNCGIGAAPNPAAFRAFFGSSMLAADLKLPDWIDYRGYFKSLDQHPPSLNVGVLAGHGTIRSAAMGTEKRAPTAAEMADMRKWLDDAIGTGALGLSTGLIYEPGRYARTDEILELTSVMRGSSALYASHMRDEGERLLESIEETIAIGEGAGVPVQISHHKASGRENWGKVRDSLRLIETARARGADVTADQYPYTSGSTILAAVVQNGAFQPESGGAFRTIRAEEILLASVSKRPEWEGRTLKALSEEMGIPALNTARRVLAEEPGAIVILETMNEDDVLAVMRHPSTMIGSDGIAAPGKPHPRLYGTFPRVLGRYARDGGVMSMQEAVHRMSGMPAAKFRLENRGMIREGAFADLVLFDPKRILDLGTYHEPRRYPDGIRYVFVNGTAVVREGSHTHARPGRAIRRG